MKHLVLRLELTPPGQGTTSEQLLRRLEEHWSLISNPKVTTVTFYLGTVIVLEELDDGHIKVETISPGQRSGSHGRYSGPAQRRDSSGGIVSFTWTDSDGWENTAIIR